jgi:hypothetical protein
MYLFAFVLHKTALVQSQFEILLPTLLTAVESRSACATVFWLCDISVREFVLKCRECIGRGCSGTNIKPRVCDDVEKLLLAAKHCKM